VAAVVNHLHFKGPVDPAVFAITVITLFATTLVACSLSSGSNNPDTSGIDKKCENHPDYKMCANRPTQP
jgi:hypothetical protein